VNIFYIKGVNMQGKMWPGDFYYQSIKVGMIIALIVLTIHIIVEILK